MPLKKNVIVLVVDGLHNGFLGAYGNSWIATSGCDRLASESVLFDRHYTVSLDFSPLYRSFWFGLNPDRTPDHASKDELPNFPGLPQLLQEYESQYRTILLTDEIEVAHNLFAEGFSKVVLLDAPQRETPAESLEETQFFRMFASIVDLLAGETPAVPERKPFFLWAHLKGFSGVWDFPQSYREEQMDEDDPTPYPDTVPPRIDYRACDESSDPDPDELRSVIEAYSAGVAVFDEAFDSFFESFQNEQFGENTLLILTSARGFSLGEHGFIGVPAPDDLWGENVHVPLAVHFPRGEHRMVRTASLTQSTDLFATLTEYLGVPTEPHDSLSVLPLLEDERRELRKSVRIDGDETVRAEVFPDWFFRFLSEHNEIEGVTERTELYRKPGDRYEINEIADRCEDVIEELIK